MIKRDKYYNELCETGLKKRYRSIPIIRTGFQLVFLSQRAQRKMQLSAQVAIKLYTLKDIDLLVRQMKLRI